MKKVSPKKITASQAAHTQTWTDAKNALLLVSLIVNLLVLIVWLALRFTNVYDSVLSKAILAR